MLSGGESGCETRCWKGRRQESNLSVHYTVCSLVVLCFPAGFNSKSLWPTWAACQGNAQTNARHIDCSVLRSTQYYNETLAFSPKVKDCVPMTRKYCMVGSIRGRCDSSIVLTDVSWLAPKPRASTKRACPSAHAVARGNLVVRTICSVERLGLGPEPPHPGPFSLPTRGGLCSAAPHWPAPDENRISGFSSSSSPHIGTTVSFQSPWLLLQAQSVRFANQPNRPTVRSPFSAEREPLGGAIAQVHSTQHVYKYCNFPAGLRGKGST